MSTTKNFWVDAACMTCDFYQKRKKAETFGDCRFHKRMVMAKSWCQQFRWPKETWWKGGTK